MQISVAIRVSGDMLDPDLVGKYLQVTPHVARRKGDVHMSISGKEVVSKFGYWAWKSEDVSGSLTVDEHIHRIQTKFEHVYEALRNLPNAEHIWVDVCVVKNVSGGDEAQAEFLLSAKSIAILSDIGLPVEFTIY
jgi:hypothetical protein